MNVRCCTRIRYCLPISIWRLILNRPGEEHRITTGQIDPCLLAYAWIGPNDRLSQPGMKFSKTRKRVEQGI